MVEDDRPTEGVDIEEPFDPSLIRITSTPMVINLLMDRIHEKALILNPDFQRNFVWKEDAQSRLIESLLIRIPIPAFYMDATDEDKWLVIDGLQRLSTLRCFVLEKSLKLTGLEYLKQLHGNTFDDLPRNLQRRILETQVVVYKIESGTPNKVKFNIFKRINTGGLPLSYQEIRHALNLGPASILLEKLATSEHFKVATANSVPSNRMQDREFVLRALTFMLTSYRDYKADDWDNFLNNKMAEINKLSQEDLANLEQRFYRAMTAAYSIFGEKAFRKQHSADTSKKPINKALFETWSANLDKLDNTQLDLLKSKGIQVNTGFQGLMTNHEFEAAISQGTGHPKKVTKRFEDIENLISEVLNDSNS
jgi:uncharacterized protein with ParB-like and HNH nuclease domain